ncbi:MAG: helix-turn-helix transcriptional regulator [Clostridiales bacterium]|nr:helix-turn-helix transcriptional regulator [Clostridiales bacterium]
MKDLKSVLVEKRKAKGFSQSQLAKELHVAKQTVSKWENGKGMPDVSMLTAISEVLDVTVDELLTGKEPETRVEIVEKEVNRKFSFRKLVAIISPIVIVLIIAVTMMSIYIPRAINKPTEPQKSEPVYLDMDIEGNIAGFDGGMGSNSYKAKTDKDGYSYYRFTAEFTSVYTFYVTALENSIVYFNEHEYNYPPLVETEYGEKLIKIQSILLMKAGDEVKISIYSKNSYSSYFSEFVYVKMQDTFTSITVEPHSEFAIALRVEEPTLVRYYMNPENWRHTAENLAFDRLLKLKYIDRSGEREYEELWRADDKNGTGSKKVLETVLKPFEAYKYEGYLNILIFKNPTDKVISVDSHPPFWVNEFVLKDEIEEIELDKIYEFSFNDETMYEYYNDTRFKYYKITITHNRYQKYKLCFDRFTYGGIYEIYSVYDMFNNGGLTLAQSGDAEEQVIKNEEIYFANTYWLKGGGSADNSPEAPKTYYIKVEKFGGVEKGRFYITKV